MQAKGLFLNYKKNRRLMQYFFKIREVQFMVFMRETISCIRTEQQESYSKQETL